MGYSSPYVTSTVCKHAQSEVWLGATIWQEVQLCATGLQYQRAKQRGYMRSTGRPIEQDVDSHRLMQNNTEHNPVHLGNSLHTRAAL